MHRIDETRSEEDAKGITDALTIIENLADVDPSCLETGFAKVRGEIVNDTYAI
jgi:hypothetical protein